MKKIALRESWPTAWKQSYRYDLEEIYGEIVNHGYAYAYANRKRLTLAMITEVLPAGARVLDIAAAQGNFSLSLAEMGYDMTWNDLRADLADYVRLKHECGNLTFAPGDVFSLDFSSPFDAVLITEIIEHVAHPDVFLAKVATLVKPGGYIVMTTPNGRYFRNHLPRFSECPDPSIYEAIQFQPNADGHIFLLHPDEIGSLAAQAGLQVERIALFTTPLMNGHLGTRHLLPHLPRRAVESLDAIARRLPMAAQERLLVQMGVRFRRATNTTLRVD